MFIRIFILATLALSCINTQDLRTVLNNLELAVFKGALETTTIIDENGQELTLMESFQNLGGMAHKLTIFAATDTALSRDHLPSDNDEKAKVLKFHAITDTNVLHMDTIKTHTSDTMNYIKTSYQGATIRFNKYIENPIITAQGAPIDENNGRNDVTFDNGIVHVINGVMKPPSQSIWEYIESNEDFTTLTKTIKVAGMEEVIRDTQPLTIFAPDNNAFNNIPTEELEQLMSNISSLIGVLNYHIVDLGLWKNGIQDDVSYETRHKEAITFVTNPSGNLYIQNSTYCKVITADISTTNGVVHVIDRVLKMPADANAGSKINITSITLLLPLIYFML